MKTLSNLFPPSTIRSNVGDNKESDSSSASRFCSTCLGLFPILYLSESNAFVSQIQTVYKQENYNVKDFSLTVMIPSSCLVREYAVSVVVPDGVLRRGTNDIREVSKTVLINQLQRGLNLKYNPESLFNITVEFAHTETALDHHCLTQIPEADFRIRKIREKGKSKTVGDSRENVQKSLKLITGEMFKQVSQCPPEPVKSPMTLSNLKLSHAPVLVGGRYVKLARDMSQTPWLIDSKKMTKHSVSECIGDLLQKAFRADGYKFTGAGREDADVRMLGSGRPFYIELDNPRTPTLSDRELQEVESQINEDSKDRVGVKKLAIVTSSDTIVIKQGEETKKKTYSCLIWTSKPVNQALLDKLTEIEDLQIIQRTPLRVLHRRAPLPRSKTIHSLSATSGLQETSVSSPTSATSVEPTSNLVILTLTTSAGTYIKEFIHGDLGRTRPSFGDLLGTLHREVFINGEDLSRKWVVQADLLELDVVNVDLVWPPECIFKITNLESEDAVPLWVAGGLC
ncbi:hypothetical protein BKA69DRAFT_1125580 [Paraphysoderma sedebokerense]|nr:hypothetical protein BKA69DRAFT_1125580 [Paraphysoderma sedebokerense]